MALFRRAKSRAAEAAADEEVVVTGIGGAAGSTGAAGSADVADDGDHPVEPDVPREPTAGPYDRGDRGLAPDQIDLGALWLVGVDGMQLRLDVDQESGDVTAATLLDQQSQMQIQVFAAPKSGGIWSEIRDEIVQAVQSQGGSADEVVGPWGLELVARLPGAGAGPSPVFNPARFIGIDGPRWFLRAVITGPAAADERAAAGFLETLRGCVVIRGQQAMAPREVLPLTLPGADQPLEPAPDMAEEDFTPFERGPEITEIR